MMAQYLSIKKDYPDAILFFRMGDFYETFYEDAQIASKVLGIALTSRAREGDKRIPLAGVPYHSAETYIARLVKAGYKVAICEQIEDPKQSKGLVKRKVVEVITAGTVTSDLLLEEKENNYLMAICSDAGRWGAARADLSTGEFVVLEGTQRELLEEISKSLPSEILIGTKTIDEELIETIKSIHPGVQITEVDPWLFDLTHAHASLLEHFAVTSLEGFGCAELKPAVGAAGAVVTYLKQTQKRNLSHIVRIEVHNPQTLLEIDEDSLANLEILKPLRNEDKQACLVATIDRTMTAMGGRILRSWLKNPLIERQKIEMRHSAVDELFEDKQKLHLLRDLLSRMRDLERLQAKVCSEKAGPRDLLAIRDSLNLLPEIKNLLAASKSDLIDQLVSEIPDLTWLSNLISSAILEDAPSVFKPGCVINPQYDKRLAEIQKTSREARDWILELQEKERKRTGIPNLKVGYNQVFGYYIEVTRSYLKHVPPDYIRKQTLVGAERFVTDELKKKEGEIVQAEEVAEKLEEEIFKQVRSQIASQVAKIQLAARIVGELDVLASFADAAHANNYVRPVITDDIGIEIHDGRHPVVEKFLGPDQFVPNDVVLNPQNQILIITGPNMAGKSTFIRQVALIVIMAQAGSFVPAASAKIGIVDKIFTRIGAADRVARGQSTFLVEMIETAKILNNATSRSLVLLDEVGRGTSTFDGLSIAWAVVEYLHQNPRSRPLTLFATHYHELTDLERILERVKNFNVLVREYGDQIIFLRKIARGASDRSYGIQVAKLAGLPHDVIERAKEILRNLEEDEYSIGEIPRIARGQHSHLPKDIQLTLWDMEKQIVSHLRQVDVDNMTPLEAIQELARLKRLALGQEGEKNGKDKSPSRENGKSDRCRRSC